MTTLPSTLAPQEPRGGVSASARGRWLVLATAVAAGMLVDAVLDGPPGAGLVALAAGTAAGVVLLARPRPAAWWFFGGGLILEGFVAIRASVPLAAMDTLGASCLFAIGASFARGGSPAEATVRGYLARAAALIGEIPRGVASLAPPIGHGGTGLAALRRGRVTAIIVAPVLIGFAVLLGSADPVFGHLVSTPVRGLPVGSLPLHALEIGLGAVAFAALAARASRPVELAAVEREISVPGPALDASWAPLLIGLDLLFAVFVAVQFASLFGGASHVLAHAGLTYAEYARSGFWQLLAATALTGGVLVFAWVVGGRDEARRRRFPWLAGTLILLDVVVLASASRRLTLYEHAFGWTWPRLLVHAAIVGLGALLLCGLVAVVCRRVARLPTAAIMIAVLTLMGLSALNPDAFIARRNVDRYLITADLDTGELSLLSVDAAPALAAALPSLHGCPRAEVRAQLASWSVDAHAGGWASWNLARIRAADALESVVAGEPWSRAAGC